LSSGVKNHGKNIFAAREKKSVAADKYTAYISNGAV